MKTGDRVRVVGPSGEVRNKKGNLVGTNPPPARLGKEGVVEAVGETVVVRLDGDRPRNFRPADLEVI